MKIAIIGSGGREHALASTISKSSSVKEIFCIPGNAGTSKIATNVMLDIDEFDKVHKFINDNSIDLVVVGPEQPLVNGIVDYLEKFNIKVFGPNKIASQLEGSKIFTKKLCQEYNIPTANFGIFENFLPFLDELENYDISNFELIDWFSEFGFKEQGICYEIVGGLKVLPFNGISSTARLRRYHTPSLKMIWNGE